MADFAANLTQDYGFDVKRKRSLAWDKKGTGCRTQAIRGPLSCITVPCRKLRFFSRIVLLTRMSGPSGSWIETRLWP